MQINVCIFKSQSNRWECPVGGGFAGQCSLDAMCIAFGGHYEIPPAMCLYRLEWQPPRFRGAGGIEDRAVWLRFAVREELFALLILNWRDLIALCWGQLFGKMPIWMKGRSGDNSCFRYPPLLAPPPSLGSWASSWCICLGSVCSATIDISAKHRQLIDNFAEPHHRVQLRIRLAGESL